MFTIKGVAYGFCGCQQCGEKVTAIMPLRCGQAWDDAPGICEGCESGLDHCVDTSGIELSVIPAT